MYQPLSDGVPPISTIGWQAPQDLQKFLEGFYQYFEVKGFRGIVALHVSHIIALSFTIVFSFVLLFLIDWEAILSCDSEESCQSLSIWYAWHWQNLGLRRWLVLLSTLIFSLYWGFNVYQMVLVCMQACQMRSFYKEQLGIVSDESLETMLWSEVVSRLVQCQKETRLCIVQEELTALEITNIIMRQDNFIIGLTDHDAFTKNLPSWIPRRLVYTKAPLWNILLAIFPPVGAEALDHRGRLRQEFLDRPEVLARKFRFLALINLVLLLPVSMFVGVYFFMRHAQEFRSQRTSPFRKQWSDYAYWTFREYNELPHQVDARMCTAQGAAEAYIHATKPTSPVLKSLLRCAKFISGSILAALLLVALWDDTPLLFVKVQEKNLLWYLAFFGFVFAVVDSAGEEDSGDSEGKGSGSEACLHALSTPLRMYVALMKMVSCTHYLPGSWRSPAKITSLAGACSGLRRATLCKHFRRVRQELLCDFLLHRIQALAEELLGVLANPLLLWCLSDAAAEIARTMRLLQHSTPALGDWCVYGCLDPTLCGDSLLSLDGRQAYPGFRSADNQTFNEKLDKSVLSFLLNHQLLWFPDDGGPDDCRPADYFHDFYSPPICSTRASRSSSPRSIPSHPSHGIPLQDFASDPRCNGKSTGSHAANAVSNAASNAVSLEMTETLEWHADGPPGEASSMPSDDMNGGIEGALEERLPISWHAEGANAETKKEPNDWVLTHILGAPPTATKLLKEVQEFEESEMRDNGSGENYSMLPDELVRLPPITPGAPAHIAIENAAKLAVDEQRQDGLDMFGALFFWLEALRKSHRAGEETSNGNGGVFCRQPPRFLGGDFT